MNRSIAIVALLALAGSAQAQLTGPSTLQSSYMLPSNPSSGVRVISIASNGNGTGGLAAESYQRLDFSNNPIAGGYQLAGIPDGMGAFDNGDGTFTVVMNHELGANVGAQRAHGSRGAFVSQWIVRGGAGLNPNSLPGTAFQVVGARDAFDNVNLYNISTGSYQNFNSASPMPAYSQGSTFGVQGWNNNNPSRNGIGRLCSGDLAAPGAYTYTDPSGQVFGTDARIFQSGEEIGASGRTFAHVLTGAERNSSWELPRLGDFSWENSVASPFSQRSTIVIGSDDSGTGGLYVYVGTKQSTGNTIERAGLTNGSLYGLRVIGQGTSAGQPVETRAGGLNVGAGFTTSARFDLHNFGDATSIPGTNVTVAPLPTVQGLQERGDANGVTNFLRPEDISWDPRHPNSVYFVTTDGTNASGGRSRLYRASFDDVTNPTAGGTITMLLDSGLASGGANSLVSNTGASTFEMLDNMTVVNGSDGVTRVLMQEDVGNQSRLSRLWLFDTATGVLEEIAIPDANRFLTGTNPGQFLTQDEESSGIIPAPWLGEGWFLMSFQAHYASSTELVEGGQMMAIYIPQTIPTPGAAALLGLAGAVAARRRRA